MGGDKKILVAHSISPIFVFAVLAHNLNKYLKFRREISRNEIEGIADRRSPPDTLRCLLRHGLFVKSFFLTIADIQ